MKILLVATFAAALCGPCAAQSAAPAPAPVKADPQAANPTEPREPEVTRTRIEDKGSRIDELRVRGQTQRVVVTPKVGTTRSYEIIMGDAGRDAFDAAGGQRNAVGKRVWTVLDF